MRIFHATRIRDNPVCIDPGIFLWLAQCCCGSDATGNGMSGKFACSRRVVDDPVEGLKRIEIADPDDPRIAAYRDIRERDLVGRENRFIAEGRVVLEHLLNSTRFATEPLLLLENRVDGL